MMPGVLTFTLNGFLLVLRASRAEHGTQCAGISGQHVSDGTVTMPRREPDAGACSVPNDSSAGTTTYTPRV